MFLRVRLRPAGSRTGALLDGGWWPATSDPIGELSTLLPVLDAWCAPVMAVALSVDGWLGRPELLRLGDRPVPVVWLGFYRDLLVGTCDDQRQIRLMVIPSASSVTSAAAAMDIALDPANHTPAPGILARAGCRG